MIDRLKRDSSNDVSISRVYFTYEKRIRMRVKRENWKGRGGGGKEHVGGGGGGGKKLDTVTSRRLVYEVVKLKGFDVARLSDVATRCYAFRFDRCVGLTRLLRT